jgi:hypothetical protein
MGTFCIPGPHGSDLKCSDFDQGTSALADSPRPGSVGVSKPSGDPPRGFLRDKSQQQWMREDALKHEGRFGNNARMDKSALMGLKQLYCERWQEAAAVSGPNAGNAPYWAMRWERITELLEFSASGRGTHIIKLEKILQEDDGDCKAKYVKLYLGFIDWISLLRQQALLGVEQGYDEDEIRIIDKVQLEKMRLLNEVAKTEIPSLRRNFWQVARQSSTNTLEDRTRQRSQMLKIMTGDDPFGPHNPPKKRTSSDPAEPFDPESLFPHNLSAIVSTPLGIDRQAQLLGGLLFNPDDENAVKEYEKNKSALEDTADKAASELKTLMVEVSNQGIQDAKKRMETVANLSGAEKLKAEAMIEYDLLCASRYLLGMDRQRQILGVTDADSGSVAGVNMRFSAADAELKKIAVEAEGLMRQWKGTTSSTSIADTRFTGEE